MTGVDAILEFWFGDLNEYGQASSEISARWWRKDPTFDQEIRDRFEPIHLALAAGEHAEWCDTPQGAIATVVALDQFPRNMYRRTAQMYSTDALVLARATAAIDAGHDRALPLAMRTFLYMPFMHAEDLAAQERCVALFQALVAELDGPLAKSAAQNVKFAEHHRVIVEEFGRFPHRNEILGRSSSPEEVAFLQGPNSSF